MEVEQAGLAWGVGAAAMGTAPAGRVWAVVVEALAALVADEVA